nr:hypothetical protein [Romboutsia faecis]
MIKTVDEDEKIITRINNTSATFLTEDGLRLYKNKEIKEMLETVENTKNLQIPPRGLILIPKRALLRIGMLLRDSEVAKEVRSRLLDIIHDVEVNTDIVNFLLKLFCYRLSALY